MATTGERIKKARKAAGLTQQELGKKLGVSGSMIGQYETNLRNPKHDTLFKIAKALGVMPYSLYGEEDWINCNYDFTDEVGKAFGILNALLEDEATPFEIKRLIESEIPNFDNVFEQLPDLVENIVSASIFKNLNDPGQAEKIILHLLKYLNESGKAAAIERIIDLAEMPRYQREPSTPTQKPLSEK